MKAMEESMDGLGWLTVGLSTVWFITEVTLSFRKRSPGHTPGRDRLSLQVMRMATVVSIGITVAAEFAPVFGGAGRIAGASPYLGLAGCLLMIAGMVVRFAAIVTLDRQFTVDVAIVEDHKIIDKGLYAVIRHPSYSGSLLTFLGLGLAFENWISLAILCVVPLAATLYRISVEESALLDHFGSAYREYRARTKSLIPGVF
jgi:protein-S-isoprenylcysteine O-methyltransferase Ste14